MGSAWWWDGTANPRARGEAFGGGGGGGVGGGGGALDAAVDGAPCEALAVSCDEGR